MGKEDLKSLGWESGIRRIKGRKDVAASGPQPPVPYLLGGSRGGCGLGNPWETKQFPSVWGVFVIIREK